MASVICFNASKLLFGFMEPEVTIFGKRRRSYESLRSQRLADDSLTDYKMFNFTEYRVKTNFTDLYVELNTTRV